MEMMKHTKDVVGDHSGNLHSDLTVIVVISLGGKNGFEVLKESTYRYGSLERKPLVLQSSLGNSCSGPFEFIVFLLSKLSEPKCALGNVAS
jgi:hypothetical protein